MSLSSSERERYRRHLALAEIGEPGQEKLRGARVLIVAHLGRPKGDTYADRATGPRPTAEGEGAGATASATTGSS